MPLCKWKKLHVFCKFLIDKLHFHFLVAVALECVTHMSCAVTRVYFRCDDPPQLVLSLYSFSLSV